MSSFAVVWAVDDGMDVGAVPLDALLRIHYRTFIHLLARPLDAGVIRREKVISPETCDYRS